MTDDTWNQCVKNVTDEWLAWLSQWRGYSLDFCNWLRNWKMIGVYYTKIALPVHDQEGNVVGVHYRTEDGNWRYEEGIKAAPLVIGDLNTAKSIFVFESQWDAFALLDRTGKYKEMSSKTAWAVIVTRGAMNARLVKNLIRPECAVFAFPQNDRVELQRKPRPAQRWLAGIREWAGCRIAVVATPEEHKDLNDWCRANATPNQLVAAQISAWAALTREPSGIEHEENTVEREPFPTHYLPSVLAGLVREQVRVLRLPDGVVACVVLGVVSASLGNCLWGHIMPNKLTPANLYVLVFGRSGLGKSELFRVCKKPLSDVENELQERWRQTTYPELKTERGLLEQEIQKLRKKVKGDMPHEDRETLKQQLVDRERRLEACNEQMAEPRLLAEDVTPQRLAVIMKANGESASVISAEAGDVLNNILGRYSKLERPDESLYVKSYSVESHTVDRISRPGVKLNSPCLAMLLMTQPDKIKTLLTNTQLMQGEFLARFLMHYTSAQAAHLEIGAKEMDAKVVGAYDVLVKSLTRHFRLAGKSSQIQASG